MNANPKIIRDIHKGENTHIQDQAMTLANFKTRKIKNKMVGKDIPPPDFLDIIFHLLPNRLSIRYAEDF